jgi:hypothetical protein
LLEPPPRVFDLGLAPLLRFPRRFCSREDAELHVVDFSLGEPLRGGSLVPHHLHLAIHLVELARNERERFARPKNTREIRRRPQRRGTVINI